MNVEQSGTTLAVTFRRRRADKWLVWILTFLAAMSLWMGVRLSVLAPSFAFSCDRRADLCRLEGADIMGGSWSWSTAVSRLVSSQVVENEDEHEVQWVVVDVDGHEQTLGFPTSRRAQEEAYRRDAAALDHFLSDSSQPTFSASYPGLGGPPGLAFAAIAVGVAIIVVRWLNGWTTRLELDRAAGTVTITRRPSLLSRRQQRFPLAQVARAELRRGAFFLVYAVVPTVTLILRDDQGKRLFARRQMADKAAVGDLVTDLKAVQAFLDQPR